MTNWKKIGKGLLFPPVAATMLTTFGRDTTSASGQKRLLGSTGAVIAVLIIAAAIYMIAVGTKKLKRLKTEDENGQ